jgi:hypothetical protein
MLPRGVSSTLFTNQHTSASRQLSVATTRQSESTAASQELSGSLYRLTADHCRPSGKSIDQLAAESRHPEKDTQQALCHAFAKRLWLIIVLQLAAKCVVHLAMCELSASVTRITAFACIRAGPYRVLVMGLSQTTEASSIPSGMVFCAWSPPIHGPHPPASKSVQSRRWSSTSVCGVISADLQTSRTSPVHVQPGR